MNIFERAVRLKIRFNFKGVISTEDLWDLSLTSLDSIFKELNAKQKEQSEESLLNVKTASTKTIDLKIEIIKYIVAVKLAEKEAKETAAENKAKKQKLMAILETQEERELHSKTPEEIRAMLAELD